MSLTFERKLPIILFFVFLMLTTVGVLFYQNTLSTQDAMNERRMSQELAATVDETVALAFEVQDALSNFLNVSNNTYLEPYERARPKLRQNIERLRAIQTLSPGQKDEVNQLDQLLKEYIAEVSRKIDLRKSTGTEYPMNELSLRTQQTVLDQIRRSAIRIKQIESERLNARDLQYSRQLTFTIWVLIISSVAGIVALGVANLTVLSENKKRLAAQGKLIEVNEGLEKSVEERTAELKKANEKLLEIGLERESILFSEKDARLEAEIANRLRDEFMATVSHELRTPLNSILGWARLMKGGNLDELQSEKALATIIKNSETQNRLIEDLLDVARVISGKLRLEMVELDAVDIVAGAIETVRPSAAAKNIHVEFKSEAGNSLVEGDRNRLVQVFTNLLGNAIKFSAENTEVHVSMRTDGNSIVTEVRDEGKGISPEFLPLIFERFRQDVTNVSNNGGLGLGLAIVRNLVEMHGGTVKAESRGTDQGSTFTVKLPLKSGDDGNGTLLEL